MEEKILLKNPLDTFNKIFKSPIYQYYPGQVIYMSARFLPAKNLLSPFPETMDNQIYRSRFV